MALALAACGNLHAPSLSSPVDTTAAPGDPDMGRVVEGRYVVAPGDTLATASARSNTPIRTLIDLNRLQPPYVLRPGQRLAIEARRVYTVQAGDSVYGIAQKFAVSRSAIVSLNNLKAPYRLQVGQTLTLPGSGETGPAGPIAAAPAKPVVSQPQPAAPNPSAGKPQPGSKPLAGSPQAQPTPSAASPNAAPLPASPSPAPVSPLPAPVAAAPAIIEPSPIPDPEEPVTADPAPAPVATPEPAPIPEPVVAPPAPVLAPEPVAEAPVVQNVGKAGFIWPADGRVISKFGTTADGLRNDGINIGAPAGAPVRAAREGVVAYAGNQLKGFGNLILLRHDNGFITAYAHNQSLLVAKGDKVKRGQVIARIGSTGNVAKPQLHFEIRKGESPVDPMAYLAAP